MIKHFLVNYESNICETSKINRINGETINTIIVALAVEVTTNITHMNTQQTKMTENEWPTLEEDSKKEKKRCSQFFGK